MPNFYQDALAYAKKRKVVLAQEFYGEIPLKARQWAFTVSRLTQLDQIQRVLDTLNATLAMGGTFKQWQEDVASGKVKVTLSPHHAANVFRTNIQSAYSQGRWMAQERNLADAPYLMYDAINDSRTRPAHAAMDGHIAPATDAIWKQWYTPAGHNCRCTIISLSEEEARARGYTGQPAPNVAPDQGWGYDRRGNWQEGMQNAIDRRLNQCQSHQFSRNVGVPSWCAPGKIRDALSLIQDRLSETPDQNLMRELQAGLRGNKYQQELSKITHFGPLNEPEAVALRLWSGDTAKEKPYEVIGNSIRALGQGKDAPEFRKVAAIVAGVSRALEKLPPANIPLAYRVIKESNLPADIRDSFMKAHTTIGNKVQYNSFTAFSSSEEMAWGQFGGTADSWTFIVESPRLLKDIDAYTAKKANEHLAPLMTQYKVVEVDKVNKKIAVIEVPDSSKTNLPKSHNFSASAEYSSREERIRARAKEEGWTDDELHSLLNAYKELDEFLDRRQQQIKDGTYAPPVLTEEQKRWGEIMQYG